MRVLGVAESVSKVFSTWLIVVCCLIWGSDERRRVEMSGAGLTSTIHCRNFKLNKVNSALISFRKVWSCRNSLKFRLAYLATSKPFVARPEFQMRIPCSTLSADCRRVFLVKLRSNEIFREVRHRRLFWIFMLECGCVCLCIVFCLSFDIIATCYGFTRKKALICFSYMS